MTSSYSLLVPARVISWFERDGELLAGAEVAEGDRDLPVRVILDSGVGLRYARNR